MTNPTLSPSQNLSLGSALAHALYSVLDHSLGPALSPVLTLH